VEISALMPWLSGTAFLHTALIQEKRGMFKQLSITLIILTYNLVIIGTFLTRSGFLSSVHSFAESRIGIPFLVFITLTLFLSLGLLGHRWNDLKSTPVLRSFFSREALIIISVMLLLGLLATCFCGVFFPPISELVTDLKVNVGPPFYERVAAPILGAVLILLVLCPLSVWSYFSFKHLGRLLWKPAVFSLPGIVLPLLVEIRYWPAIIAFWLVAFVLAVNLFEIFRRVRVYRRQEGQSRWDSIAHVYRKNRRSFSAMIIHIGVVLMALGIIGIEVLQTETQGTIPEGGVLALGSYTITYDRLDIFDTNDGRNVAQAVVSLQKNGRDLGELYPRRDFYYDISQPMTLPSVRSTLADDVYVILIDWKEISREGATFKIYHNPLVKWLWIGAWVFIIGIVSATWPEKKKLPVAARGTIPVR
jgi:cytochrome c-type biogenesis protein CcmF